jgi:hypothetical protein
VGLDAQKTARPLLLGVIGNWRIISMPDDFLEFKCNEISAQVYDLPCKICGTIISFSLGVSDCPRCAGLTVKEQIELHNTQDVEYESRRKLGLIFFFVAVILVILFSFLLL